MESEAYAEDTIEAYRLAYKDSENIDAMCARLCGLSDTEYWILMMLREGCETQSDISEQMSISKQTINSACKQLIKKGLVRLETLANNLRTKRILLTESGEQFIEEYINPMFEIEERVWYSMTKEERSMLTRLTRKYNALMLSNIQQYQKKE